MSTSFGLSPALVAYLGTVNPPEHPVLRKCREETAVLGGISVMQISAEQGAVMQWFARLLNAKRAVEVGVFTGYSSLAVGLTMREMHGPDARILACDVSEEWTAKARTFWAEAGIADIIDLQIRPAVETLDTALKTEAGAYDLAFIDADKTSYDAYYERCLKLLRTGGVMLFDNVLWSGKVADPAVTDADTSALRALNLKARDDSRVHSTLVAIGDGLLMCIKK
jgi:O-methyltransferase